MPSRNKLKILFSAGNSVISKLIMSITREDVCHVAILVGGDTVIHSTLLGVQIDKLSDFLSSREVKYEREAEIDPRRLLVLLRDNRGYDYVALLTGGIRLLLKKLFNLDIIRVHNVSGAYMCTELINMYLFQEEYPDMTPRQLLRFMDEQGITTA